MTKYNNSGITPKELLMRQQGKCYLEISDIEKSGEFRLYCTDGEDRALTEGLANPTQECSICFTRFILGIFAGKLSNET